MIIGYKKQFKPKILAGTKIHTLREDVHNRWHAGKLMHMACGVRTKEYECFCKEYCKGTQLVLLDTYHEHIGILNIGIVNRWLTKYQVQQFAINDGFDKVEDFWEWFRNAESNGKNSGPLKLIHWTDFRY